MKSSSAIDTNILIYAVGGEFDESAGSLAQQAQAREENRKSAITNTLLAESLVISIQVFNEFTNIARKKLGFKVREIQVILESLNVLHTVTPLTWDTVQLALAIAKNRDFSTYDSLIVAAALIAGCKTLYSEDIQHKRLVLGQLRIVNPFKESIF